MKKHQKILFGAVIAATLSAHALADDKPSEILISAATTQPAADTSTPQDRWQSFIQSQGWNDAAEEGGVSFIPDRNLVISSASAFTNVDIGQPGWIESRVAAFERAELEAKTRIIRFLSESGQSARSTELLEKASWSDGSVEEAKKLNEVAETLKKLGKKTLALTDAALDSALKKLDENYDPSEYENETPEQKKTVLEDKFKRKTRFMAMRTSIGVTPIYSTEGKDPESGQYQVLVGVVWSPKLNRVAMSLFNDEYNMPALENGKPVSEYLPKNPGELIGTLGSRIVVDEKGHFVVLSYAQAQPRKSAPTRQGSALELAKQIAAERARAQIINFVREGLVFNDSEASDELTREFSDQTVGTETLREFRKKIVGRKNRIRLRGVRTVKQWSATHPVTGQKLAGAVIAWSPSSAELSHRIDNLMKSKPAAQKAGTKGANDSATKGPAIESIKVDTSAY